MKEMRIVFALLAFCAAAPAAEIVQNPGFDLDADHNGLPDHWSTTRARVRWREKQYLSRDYVLISRPGNYVLATQDIRLVKGKQYTLTLRVKTENGGLAGALIVHGPDKPRREMPLIWRAETGPRYEEIVRTFRAPNPVARLYIYNVARTKGTVYYDRVSIREGAPDYPIISQLSLPRIDRPLGPPPETPHIAWAAPLAGGPIKAFITLRSFRCLRDTEELKERLDLDADVVAVGYDGRGGVSETGRRAMQRLKNKAYEVYVVPSRVNDAFAKAIRARVRTGAGLVVLEGFGRAARFVDAKALRAAPADHFLRRGIPWPLLPEKILKSVEIGACGKGRVARLVFPLSVSRVWGLLPTENSKAAWKSRQFEYWEWWESLLAKAIVWAARGEPRPRLRLVAASAARVELAAAGAPAGARARVLVRSAREIRFDGPLLRVGPFFAPVGADGRLKISLPDSLPAGPVIVDAMLLDPRGRVLTWGSFAVPRPQRARIAALTASPEVARPGQTTTLRLELRAARPARATVEAKLIDAFGRVVSEARLDRALPAGASRAALRLTLRRPLCVHHKAFARVLVDGREQDSRWTTVLAPDISPRAAASDFLVMPWGPGMSPPFIEAYYAERIRALGFNAMFGRSPYLMAEQGFPGGGYVGGLAAYFRETRLSPGGVRRRCLSDPAVQEKIRRRVREAAAEQKPFGLFAIGITDEAFLTSRHRRNEVCFGPHCQARYRAWLRKRYGSLDRLNTEWGAAYRSWDEIRGARTEDVRGKSNFAPFVDFRTFMTDVWVDACRLVVDAYHSVAPDMPIGHTNTFGANPFNGNDYWKLCAQVGFGWGQEYSEAIKPSGHKAIFDLWRSFCETPEARAARTPPGRPPRPFFNYGWIGYHHIPAAARYEPWWLALHGSRGASYYAANAVAAQRNISWALVYPTLSYTPYSLAVRDALADLRGGCGKVFLEFQREAPVAALLWSHPSMLVAWCESSWDEPVPNECDSTDAYGAHFRSALFFRRHLNELQLDYAYVAPEQVLRGDVLRKYRMLILPFTIAASDALAEKLAQYVAAGGVLVGDLRCLRTDEHGKPTPDSAALTRLFGVRRIGPVRYGPTTVTFRRAGEGLDLRGRRLAAFGRERIAAAGAQPLAAHETGEPAVLVRRLGKGLTVYLNFTLPAYDVAARELMRQVTARAGIPRLVAAENPKPGGPPPLCYERDTFARGPITVHAFIRDYRRCSDHDPVRFRFGRMSHVYDLRARKYLGRTDAVQTTLAPGDTALYALLPYRVLRVEASVPAQAAPGADLPITARVIPDAGRPGDHVVHLELINPAGESAQHYTRNLLALGGRLKTTIPLALNEARGRWTIRIRDVLSGCAGEVAFACR